MTARLQKLQLGRETTAGPAVVATAVWRGKGTWDDQTIIKFADENVGILPDVNRIYIPAKSAMIHMEPVEATFEQIQAAGLAALVLCRDYFEGRPADGAPTDEQAEVSEVADVSEAPAPGSESK
jgi:hypothetical protein